MSFRTRKRFRFIAWLRARPRRLRSFKWFLAASVVVGLGAVVARPASHAIKAWQARRLSQEAIGLIAQQRWGEAAKKTRDALLLAPSERATWDAAARLLSKTGQGATALGWWKKINETRELSISDHRDFAAAALSASELSLAATEIDLLKKQAAGPAAIDYCLAAQLATLRGDARAAVRDSEQVLRDKSAEPRDVFAALALIFLNTNPDSPSYAAGLARLADLARTDNGVAGIEALQLIARTLPRLRLTDLGSTPLTIAWPKDDQNALPSSELADRLDHHPEARPADHLLALEIRAQNDPDHADEYVKQGIAAFEKGDDDSVAALAAWLYERGEFETMRILLSPERVARSGQLFLQRIDVLAALGRYDQLEQMLLAENLAIDQISQHLYLAVVRSKLGETAASANEWERALQTANTSAQFFRVAQYAEAHEAPEVADAAYKQLLVLDPRLRPAYLARLRLAEAMGLTNEAYKLAVEISRLWPDDTATRFREYYLRLLLGATPEQTVAIEQDVEDLASGKSLDANAAATLALARLRSGRAAAALSTFADVPVSSSTPNALVVRAAALAANGWKDKARDDARKLTTAKLLPEERRMLAPVLSAVDQASNLTVPAP